MAVKKSKLQRKFLNQMRGMGDVPWPARRFRYPPTFGGVQVVGSCPRVLGEVPMRRPGKRGWIRKKVQTSVVCGGPVILVPLKGLHCRDCRGRHRQRRELQRLVRMQQARGRRGRVQEDERTPKRKKLRDLLRSR